MSILWGKDRDLDYWAALRADTVPPAERRAMGLLASLSDEKRFSFYCLSGMFPAMGNVTKRMYLVRRWTTVLELEDGRPRASWCILNQDRTIAPESDHVVSMKNLLEGSEMHFREVGNAFHYTNDPFRGSVDPQAPFPNRYYNGIGPRQVASNKEWSEDSALEFKDREKWIKTLLLKAELPNEATLAAERRRAAAESAASRPRLMREALIERAKDWTRIPPKERYKLPLTRFEQLTERAMGVMARMSGNIGGFFTGDTTTNTANLYTNNGSANTTTFTACHHGQGQITIGRTIA